MTRPRLQAASEFRLRELSTTTWPDFVRFFSQGNGWDHCGCTAYQGFRAPSKIREWTAKRDWNLQLKHILVQRGLAHGILVYAEREPVGWCQFGPMSELPLPANHRKALLNGGAGWSRRGGADEMVTAGPGPAWRITCFCTLKQFAQHGVARAALRGALEAIATQGGGLVEASPVALIPESDAGLGEIREWRRERSRLIKAYGRFSEETERHLAAPPRPKVLVEGIGEINGADWVYGGMHPGTVSMFQSEGFVGVAPIGVGPRATMQRVV
jgi:hypothetical protein